jgi:spermidine dehydrogenase
MAYEESTNQNHERALGMQRRISRRDYLNSVLIASGSALLNASSPLMLPGAEDWDGYSGVGDYQGANGNTWQVVSDGHKIRDHAYDGTLAGVVDTGEVHDCVVVGGGISGLAAALFFAREAGAKRTCLVLDNHAIFGGEAKRNEFLVDRQRLITHQGSAMWFPPLPGTFLAEFYDSIHIHTDGFQYQEWTGEQPQIRLGRTPYTSGGKTSAFFFGPRFGETGGLLLVDPWGKRLEGAPIPEAARAELLSMRGSRSGRLPAGLAHHGDAVSRNLDSITMEQHLMERHSLSRDTVRTFESPLAGGGSGLGADALSGYADYAADVLLPWDYAKGSQMFPGGNAGVARHIVKSLMPEVLPGPADMASICRARVQFAMLDRPSRPTRIRLNATTVSVRHEGRPGSSRLVRVVYAKSGKLYGVRARAVIIAGGSWTAKHIVKDLPAEHQAAYARFYRAPCLMANVALQNWRFLYDLGISECRWFEGIGNYFAIRKTATLGDVSSSISPDSPVVLTLKILFSSPGLPIGEQVSRGRAELFSTPFRVYERRIREQLAMMFGRAGFDPQRDIAGLILNRWGHAYLSPQPGFFFGAGGSFGPGEILRNQPHGRIAFANSDLTGIMDHRTSILEAHRAVGQVLERQKTVG